MQPRISDGRRFVAFMRITRQLQGLISFRWMAPICGTVLMLALVGSANAQAPPGPMAPPRPGTAPEAPPPSEPGRAPARIGGKPALAGEWKLNRSDSDDPRQRLQQATNPRGMGGGRGGWGGPGGGGPGGPGGGGGYGGRGQGGNGQGDVNSMMSDLSYLTIRQTDKKVTVQTDSGRLLAEYPLSDQGSSKSEDSQSSKNNSAQWQGDALVIVTQGRSGGKTTRTFELSSDGSQLYMTTRMEGGRLSQPVTFRLAYDPSNP
jgi:hypothetical protein